MKRKILILGSNSFSGSDLIDLLLEDKQNLIIGVSRSPEKTAFFLPYKRHGHPQFTFFQIDINRDLAKLFHLIDRFKPAYIVNFAAQSEVAPSWLHPDHWYHTNVLSLVNFANWLNDKKFVKRYVQISSPEVYGSTHGIIKEDALLNPSTPYAASKAAADLFLLTLYKNFRFPCVFIRSTNVYGAHQQLFKIIPRTIIYIKLNKKVALHGGGIAVKSYIHIRDVSRGEYQAMLQGKNGEIYHFSPKEGIAVKDVVKLICKKLGADFHQSVAATEERLGQDAAYVIDSTKAQEELGWKPQISYEKGIAEVIEWIFKNWNVIQTQSLSYIHKR